MKKNLEESVESTEEYVEFKGELDKRTEYLTKNPAKLAMYGFSMLAGTSAGAVLGYEAGDALVDSFQYIQDTPLLPYLVKAGTTLGGVLFGFTVGFIPLASTVTNKAIEINEDKVKSKK